MNTDRPVFLNLTQIRFPIAAIISILHRVTGVVIFLTLPLLLYMLHESLVSQQTFLALQQSLSNPFIKIFVWLLMAAGAYHILAGVRHLLMDIGWFESLSAARVTAITVLILEAVVIVLLGAWLW